MSVTHRTLPTQITVFPKYVRLPMIPQGNDVVVSQSQVQEKRTSTSGSRMISTRGNDNTVLIAFVSLKSIVLFLLLACVSSVMGTTGSGKTTSINSISDSNLRTGKTLHSCTTVQLSQQLELDGRQATLIDIAGFDDTTKSDADILNMIAAFLATTYEQRKKLTGVLYLHYISDTRTGGVSTRNFKMFMQLCGPDALKNVALVTNMWEKIGHDVGEARGMELRSKDKFWKPVLDKGAQVFGHDNTAELAQAIVRYVVDKQLIPLRELVDHLTDTAADAELNRELMEQIEKHQAEMRDLEKEMKEAINARDEIRQKLEIERNSMQAEMSALQTNSQKLATAYSKQKAQLEKKLEESRKLAERAHKKQKQSIDEFSVQLRNTQTTSAVERHSLQKRLDDALKRYNGSSGGGLFGNIGRAIGSFFGF